jgi:hypothetical protein
MAKRTGTDALTKHHHYSGLKLLGENHPDYERLKKMLDEKYDPKVKTTLTQKEKKELENLAINGLAEYNRKQQEGFNRHFTEE